MVLLSFAVEINESNSDQITLYNIRIHLLFSADQIRSGVIFFRSIHILKNLFFKKQIKNYVFLQEKIKKESHFEETSFIYNLSVALQTHKP